jgi:hypothetical protein
MTPAGQVETNEASSATQHTQRTHHTHLVLLKVCQGVCAAGMQQALNPAVQPGSIQPTVCLKVPRPAA